MATREEIREGIAFELFWIDGGAGDRIDAKVYWDTDEKARKEYRYRATLLVQHLHSKDVVIKVDIKAEPRGSEIGVCEYFEPLI